MDAKEMAAALNSGELSYKGPKLGPIELIPLTDGISCTSKLYDKLKNKIPNAVAVHTGE